jgi:hypothetical protein
MQIYLLKWLNRMKKYIKFILNQKKTKQLFFYFLFRMKFNLQMVMQKRMKKIIMNKQRLQINLFHSILIQISNKKQSSNRFF